MSKLRLGEQIGDVARLGETTRRQLKRDTARKFRRMGKRLGDEAPRKARYRGWSD